MNQQLTYLLADDDAVYRDFLKEQLDTLTDLHCIAMCEDSRTARDAIQKLRPDIIFLDVEMPGLSGIQLARSLDSHPIVIFITSHPAFAADAFEVDAVDYLVKPVSPERLLKALDKAKQLMSLRNEPAASKWPSEEEAFFFIKEKQAYLKIMIEEVQFIESLGDFVTLYLSNGQKRVVLGNMKSIEQQLPAKYFLRISRKHMVNRNKVTAVEGHCLYLGNMPLPIGQTYISVVEENILGNKTLKRFQ